MNCKNCKQWELKKDNLNMGYCHKVKMFWDATEWNLEEEDELGELIKRDLKSEFKNEKAFVQDGSDYKAYLITTHDFGCVQFENKKL